jgi:hypothetical protein
VLAVVILLGLWNTVASNSFGHYDYRDGSNCTACWPCCIAGEQITGRRLTP